MAKTNPFDLMVDAFTTEYSKIPNFSDIATDDDLSRAHTFVATRITSMHSIRDLVIGTFLPAVERRIVESRKMINTSRYKEVVKDIKFDIEEIRYDTIRLGYVFCFHKYEVLVKDYMKMMEDFNIDPDEPSKESLTAYMLRRFQFDPFKWHLYPVVHKVQFVNNCTKHWDGFCKVYNSKYPKPVVFADLTEDDQIKPKSSEFKTDINSLIESIQTLLAIVGDSSVLKITEENLEAKFRYDDGSEVLLFKGEKRDTNLADQKNYDERIRRNLTKYKNSIIAK